MSFWIKAGDRLIDADRAHDIEYSRAESDGGESTLAIRFPGGADLEITLTGPEADAAWKAIRTYQERQGVTTDLEAFMNR